MSPTPAPRAKTASIDFRKSLVETFAISEKAKQRLVGHPAGASGHALPPSGNGRSMAGTAAHLHLARLMGLSAAGKTVKLPAKLVRDRATRADVQSGLQAGASPMHALLEKARNHPAGKFPQFEPDRVALPGYLIAHDWHNRGQIARLSRQVGHRLPSQTGFGLGERETLWRECGFGR